MTTTTATEKTVKVGQMQTHKRRRERIIGKFSGVKLTFRLADAKYPDSRVAFIKMPEKAAEMGLNPDTRFRAWPVEVFLPFQDGEYVVDGVIKALPDGRIENRDRIYIQVWPTPGANVLTKEELLPLGQVTLQVAFKKENDGKFPIARHPRTGKIIVPSHRFETESGEKLEEGKLYAIEPQPAGNKIIGHATKCGHAASEPNAGALERFEEYGLLTDTHKQCVLLPSGVWRTFSEVLKLKTGLDVLTKDEVKSAYRKLCHLVAPDKHMGKSEVVVEQMKKTLQTLTEARERADAYIDARTKAKEEGKLDELLSAATVKVTSGNAPPAEKSEAAPVQGATEGSKPEVKEKVTGADAGPTMSDEEALELLA